MNYIVNDKIFHFSYRELEVRYHKYKNMSDEDFFKDIPKLLHFVVFVSYIKQIPSEVLLTDDGLIHELVHMLNYVELVSNKEEIRELFNKLMKL